MNFAESSQGATAKKCCRPSECVPSMALILLVQVQPRVFTAKCSEPQIGISKGMVEKGASGVDGVTVEELGSYPAYFSAIRTKSPAIFSISSAQSYSYFPWEFCLLV